MKSLSIKWRLALLATALSIALIAILSFIQSSFVRSDLRDGISTQQTTLVRQVAQDIDAKFATNLAVLSRSAAVLPEAVRRDPDRFNQYFEDRPAVQLMFSDLLLIGLDGRTAANFPSRPARVGTDYSDRPYFREVMATGKTVISEPFMGRRLQEPLVVMAAPVFDADGRTTGVLVGAVRLLSDDYLGRLSRAKVGNTGYYILLTRGPTPVFVMHPDKRRILQPRPANGSISTRRGLDGFEGTAEDINSYGVEALFSYTSLKSTGWLLVSVLPTEEAFAPLVQAGKRTVIAALVVALIVTPLVWLLAWRLLAPLSKLTASIASLHSNRQAFSVVEIERDDEIGWLAQEFNVLLEKWLGAEAGLRASEARIRSITDNLPALVCYIDREHRFVFNNLAYERWLARPLASITGKSVAEIYGPEIYARLCPDLDRALAGVRTKFEIEFPGRDGEVHHARGTYLPHRDEAGEVVGVYGLITDETRLKQAENALRTNRLFLQRTGEVAGVGGWQVDLISRVIVWSDTTCRLHDLEPGHVPTLEEAIGYCAPEARPVIEEAMRQALANGTGWDIELPLVSARGRRFWARAVGTVEHEDGRPVRVIGALQDVTARKAIESERDASRELLQVTLDSIGDAVITTDTEGGVLWLNPVAERMTGWLKAEAMGKPLLQVFVILHQETRKPAEDPVRHCLAEGKIVGLARETVLISRDGTEYGIEDSASPIRDADGRGYGAVLVFHDVSEQRRLSQEMTHRASHDELTGLFNRGEFEARLDRVFAGLKLENSNNVLLYIDLDQFKLVNDACGHSVGDQLLKQVSSLLRNCVRGRDTVARLGGDEFGIILERCDMSHGKQTAQKICDQMEEFRFLHDGRRFRVGASIGLVPVDRRWMNMAQVLQAADTSCYAAKEAGRNRVHVWFDTDGAMKTRKGEMQWASRLEQALDEDRFELHGQRIETIVPQGQTGGLHCEVLVRLRDIDGRLIPPGAFLPAAERFNMATRIDRWVVRRTFDWIEQATREGHDIEMIAINLSGHSIGDRAFHRDIRELVGHAGFDVRHLCFEITETAAITNLSDAKVFIGEMRSLGVKIALDDFGAGASSFGYLKSLPVDYLKIDGQFIINLLDDPLDNAAVRCFREVAAVVGVTTIAECVERRDVLEALKEIGIDMAQGYLIHRPEPLENIFGMAARPLLAT